MATTREKGIAAEHQAAVFLAGHGLTVVERNFRVRGGEIDLVCRDGNTVVFVEVRLRGSVLFGGAAASITAAKRMRLVLAARHWLARHGSDRRPCRFDCLLFDGTRIEWLQDAFAAE